MDDKKLTALLTAVEYGSLSKAASVLGYTQAGLTQMMNSVEEELGCQILIRSYNGIKLTSVGEKLLPFIKDASSSIKHLKEEANHYIMKNDRSIRIGIYPSITKSWLPAILKEYKKIAPGTSIEITVGGEEMPKYLDQNIIDIAIAEESQKDGYQWIPICEDPYYAIVPKDHPLSLKNIVQIQELLEYPFIMSQISELKAQLKPFITDSLDETIQINAIDDDALISLVEQGLGVSVLPELSLKGVGRKLCILNIEPDLKRTLGIMMPRSVRKPVSEFVDFVSNLDITKY